MNGGHTVWLIQSRGFEMKLPEQAEKQKFVEMRASRILPFYKKYLKMLKRPKNSRLQNCLENTPEIEAGNPHIINKKLG